MNVIIILFRNNPQMLQYHFDKYDDALKVQRKFAEITNSKSLLEFSDDYGSTACFATEEISCVSVVDMEREMKAHKVTDIMKLRKDVSVQRELQSENGRIAIPGRA